MIFVEKVLSISLTLDFVISFCPFVSHRIGPIRPIIEIIIHKLLEPLKSLFKILKTAAKLVTNDQEIIRIIKYWLHSLLMCAKSLVYEK